MEAKEFLLYGRHAAKYSDEFFCSFEGTRRFFPATIMFAIIKINTETSTATISPPACDARIFRLDF